MTPTVGGRALVATPTIGDDRFAHSVILMLDHNDDGALGVVLDQPDDVAVGDVVPKWAARAASPAIVFAGGPVATDRGLGIARIVPGSFGPAGQPGIEEAVTPIAGFGDALALVDLSVDPDDLPPGIIEVRVFAGCSGWGAGQLDAELAVGAWWVTDVGVDDAFTTDPAGLWRRVVARQPGERALFARFTGDPGLN